MDIKKSIVTGIISPFILTNPALSENLFASHSNPIEQITAQKPYQTFNIRRNFEGDARGIGLLSINSSDDISVNNMGIGNTLTFGGDYLDNPGRNNSFVRSGLDIGRGYLLGDGFTGGFSLGLGTTSYSFMDVSPHANMSVYFGSDNMRFNLSARRGLSDFEQVYGTFDFRF